MTQKEIAIFPYFQPIIGVANGNIVGYEALARQYDEQGKVISAGDIFSSTAYSDEDLRELDRKVRWMALQKFSELEDTTTYLTINISAAWIDYLTNTNSLPTLEMLDKLNIDRSRIIIEITEAAADIDKLKQVVNKYRENGLKVAIDDYGAGYSQLDRVIALNPDIIKIDMRLFKMAAKGGAASEAVKLLTRFGKRSGAKIICEGVENMREFLFGLSCGAQYMQGFLFSAAEEKFIEIDTYQQHIASLRTKFFARKLEDEKKKTLQFQEVKKLAYRLKEALQNDFNLNELAAWGLEGQGVLKFYLCNSHGEQISPDFNFRDEHWFCDATKKGYNWSWRSYFYQIIALKQCGIENEIVVSESYLDFDSGLLCKTLSLYLDKERMLMIDIKNEL